MVKIWSFLKNWLSLIAVTVSTERKNLGTKEISFDQQKTHLHQPACFHVPLSMKDFIEKEISTRRKKTITGRSLLKMEKKMVFNSQKISCPLATISSFLDCLLLFPIMVATSSQIALTKKMLFLLSRISVSTSRMKDIEKEVSTYGKVASFWKISEQNRKNRCPPKNRLSLISLIVSISRKNSD